MLEDWFYFGYKLYCNSIIEDHIKTRKRKHSINLLKLTREAFKLFCYVKTLKVKMVFLKP
jgi:hypothetical protein